MLKINTLKSGDIIMVNDEEIMREGIVINISHEEHQALVDNGIQEFWYKQNDMFPVPLNEEQLLKMGFSPEESENGIKYKKDSFRLITHQKGDFSKLEMWWREDRRHFDHPLAVHELQNLYFNMTKFHLDRS